MEDNNQILEEKEYIVVEETYTKQAILNSERYYTKKDLVNALLDNDKKYTLQEVDSIINKYLKGVIK